MKRHDTVYFWHTSTSGKRIIRIGTVNVVNPDTILIAPRGSKKILTIPKTDAALNKESLISLG